jgi:ParB-like chromosome segregation protein Spo0J
LSEAIQIPPVELVDVASLKVDGQNPNKMSVKQHKALRESILTYGFIIPIITNKDLLIADGEQRLQEAKALGMKQVQVIKLPVEDVDRRLLRQVLNKLKGEHELKADAEEFKRIIDAGREAYLKKAEIEEDVISGKVDPIKAVELCKAVFRRFKWKRNAVLKAHIRVDGNVFFAGKSVCGKCHNVRVCPLGPTSQCSLFEEART